MIGGLRNGFPSVITLGAWGKFKEWQNTVSKVRSFGPCQYVAACSGVRSFDLTANCSGSAIE